VANVDSQRSLGIFQQLRLAIQYGMAYKMYDLMSRIDAIKAEIELAVDEHQIASLATRELISASTTNKVVQPSRSQHVLVL